MTDPVTGPWEKYHIRLYDWEHWARERDLSLERLDLMAIDNLPVKSLANRDSEGALEMIENSAGAGNHYHLAANLPNVGQIANLPAGAIVETPVFVDGAGIHPVHVGALPINCRFCRRELVVTQLCVDAVVEGSRQKALKVF